MSKIKTTERKNVYYIVGALLAILVVSILMFTKMPSVEPSGTEKMIDKISTSLQTYTEAMPEGWELVGEIIVDANGDGLLDCFREYKNGEKYDVKLFFTSSDLQITPAGYSLIDDPETQECFLGVDKYTYQPMAFIKETTADSITYSVLNYTEEGKSLGASFAEKTVDGVKKYYSNDTEISEDDYHKLISHEYSMARFSQASTILVPESYFIP